MPRLRPAQQQHPSAHALHHTPDGSVVPRAVRRGPARGHRARQPRNHLGRERSGARGERRRRWPLLLDRRGARPPPVRASRARIEPSLLVRAALALPPLAILVGPSFGYVGHNADAPAAEEAGGDHLHAVPEGGGRRTLHDGHAVLQRDMQGRCLQVTARRPHGIARGAEERNLEGRLRTSERRWW
jgi:hypothetical protein